MPGLLFLNVVDHSTLGVDEVGDEGDDQKDSENRVDTGGTEGLGSAAERNTNDGEVEVAKRSVLEAKDVKNGQEQGRGKGDEQAVDESTKSCTLATARGIAVDTGGSTAEEVGNHARDDEDAQGSAHDEHTDHATDKGSDKAEDDGGGSIREEDGAVDGGDGTGDQLVGDALESRDQVGENHTDAVVDDSDTDGEGQGTSQGIDDHIVAASGLGNDRRICDVSGKSGNQVEESHGKSRGDSGVAQEGKLLGNLDLLGAVLLGVLSKKRTDCSGDVIGE